MGADASNDDTQAGGRLTIDLSAIAANWRLLRDRARSAECAAAVKADAYGTGIATTVRALADAGCRTFFVAHLAEARRVRQAAPGGVVYVLNGLAAETCDTYAALDLRPVLGAQEDLVAWRGFVAASGWAGPAALHFDTGMNRLGLPPALADGLDGDGDRIALVMSHLACAEDASHPMNRRQIEAFAEIRARFPQLPASLANSSGLFLPDAIGYDMVRPGYALYGGNPVPSKPNPMAPVVRLDARILQIRTVEPGETVGYGATWTATRRTRLAILSLGYADGFLRSGSSRSVEKAAMIAAGGLRCPVVGRISMDLTAVDVTDLPDGAARHGTFIEVLGPTIGVDEAGKRAGTIGYEVLTGLGRRYHRRTIGVTA